jgi:hypothetical protein
VRAGVVSECGELMRVKGHLVNRVKPQNPPAKPPRCLTKRMQAGDGPFTFTFTSTFSHQTSTLEVNKTHLLLLDKTLGFY